MKLAIIILLSILSLSSFSQKDTLFLFNNCFIIGEKKFNQKTNGQKEGDWIEYDISKHRIIKLNIVNWSGEDSLGNSVGGSYTVYYEYAAIDNYDGNNSHKISNQSNMPYCTTIVLNYLAPENYYISSKGKYKKGLKEGKWKSYYQNGQIKKIIKFKKGNPSKSFNFYDKHGVLMMRVIPQDKKYLIYKYNKLGEKTEEKVYTAEEAEPIIE